MRRTAICALLAAASWTPLTSGGSDDPFAGYRTASTETLSTMRGGFIGTAGGQRLEIAFAIEQAILVNNQLVVATRLTIPDVMRPVTARVESLNVLATDAAAAVSAAIAGSSTSPGSAPAVSSTSGVSAALPSTVAVSTIQHPNGQLSLVQIGPGNSFALDTAQLPSGVLNIIQNTLDSQTIQQMTTVHMRANSVSVMRMMELGAVLQQQIASSLR